MSDGRPERFDDLRQSRLAAELRELANRRPGAGVVDELELRHLISVILHGALLLRDLYESERVGSVYTADPRVLARNLIAPLLADPDAREREVLSRTGRLPEEVRLLGDKCLFDVGISGMRHYRGLDLQDLGQRAYRMASEVLGSLAEDPTLRELFDRNSLGPLPIAEEVAFLRQCAERFAIHADLLLHLPRTATLLPDSVTGVLLPWARNDSATGTAVLSGLSPGAERAPEPAPNDSFDLEARRMTREDLLSAYERIVLFASLDVDRLRAGLCERVVDQPRAVEAICDEFALYAAGTHNLTKPPSYFFVGPTGVGKNYLVETLARLLGEVWGLEVPVLSIDGPNYTDASDINELRGSTRGFIRSDEEGLLAEFYARSSVSPLSFILVDEVEKAHGHLRKFFLGMMDRGTVTDNRGRSLSFANSMLFFTSNLGFSEAVQHGTPIGYRGEEEKAQFERSEVAESLRRELSAEFMNRVRIIRFEHLSRSSIEKIFALEFGKVRHRFQEVQGIDLEATERARDEILVRGYSYEFGARHLATVINQVANVEVSKRLKRDERGRSPVGAEILGYLRQMRSKERAFDPREVRARVLDAARARVPYRRLTIDFEDGVFVYRT